MPRCGGQGAAGAPRGPGGVALVLGGRAAASTTSGKCLLSPEEELGRKWKRLCQKKASPQLILPRTISGISRRVGAGDFSAKLLAIS